MNHRFFKMSQLCWEMKKIRFERVITWVTGHLATKQTRHQRTRHQGTISPPSEVFSPPTTNKEIN